MNRGEWDGEPISYPFTFLVTNGQQDEMTLGVVPAPAVVEWLSLRSDSVSTRVKLFAVAHFIPTRQNIGTAVAVQGQLLTHGVSDAGTLTEQEGVTSGSAGLLETYLGVVVPWGPWYLVARAHEVGALPSSLSGIVRVRLIAPAVVWPVPAWGTKMDARYLARVGR